MKALKLFFICYTTEPGEVPGLVELTTGVDVVELKVVYVVVKIVLVEVTVVKLL